MEDKKPVNVDIDLLPAEASAKVEKGTEKQETVIEGQ